MRRLAAVLLAFLAVPLIGVCATPCDLLGLQAEIAARAEAHWRAQAVQAGETIARIESHLLTSANPEVVGQADQFRAQVAALQTQQVRYLEAAEAAGKAAEALRAQWLACVGQPGTRQALYPVPLLSDGVTSVGKQVGSALGQSVGSPLPDITSEPAAGTGPTSQSGAENPAEPTAASSTDPTKPEPIVESFGGRRTIRFTVFTGADNQYYFSVPAANGEIVLRSEGYAGTPPPRGIDSVRANSRDVDYYDVVEAQNGQYYFNLIAANGEIIGTSELYVSQSNAERAVETLASLIAGQQ